MQQGVARIERFHWNPYEKKRTHTQKMACNKKNHKIIETRLEKSTKRRLVFRELLHFFLLLFLSTKEWWPHECEMSMNRSRNWHSRTIHAYLICFGRNYLKKNTIFNRVEKKYEKKTIYGENTHVAFLYINIARSIVYILINVIYKRMRKCVDWIRDGEIKKRKKKKNTKTREIAFQSRFNFPWNDHR